MLGDQANQCDQANLGIHIERSTRQLQRHEGPKHGQGHRQHDDQGINEAFKLSSQDQKDKEQSQHKHNDQRAL